MNKLSNEEIIQYFFECGYEYIDNKEKLYANDSYYVMDIKTGYKGKISYSNLKFNKKLSYFKFDNPFLLENVKKFFYNNNPNVEVTNIKKITKSHRQRLLITFKCECGNTFNHVFKGINGYKTKTVCPECSKIRRGKNKRRKYSDNYNLLTSMDYNILSDIRGIKNTGKIKVMDKDGYVGYTTIASALRGRGFERYSVGNNRENYIYNINVFLKNKGFKSKAIDFLEQNPKSRFPQIKLQCECGNYFNRTVNNICNFEVRCSNCARKMSTYESATNNFLKEQNIAFLREYGFNDCVDIQKLLFDFYLKDYKAIIEVDGRQHYVPTNFGNCEKTTQEIFEDIQRHDKIKNEYCRKNNIPLLRIPYWEFKTDNYKQLIIDFLSRINES